MNSIVKRVSRLEQHIETDFRRAFRFIRNRFVRQEDLLQSLDERASKSGTKMQMIEQRLDRVEQRLDSMDRREDRLEDSVAGIRSEILVISGRITEMGNQLTLQARSMFGIMLTLALTALTVGTSVVIQIFLI